MKTETSATRTKKVLRDELARRKDAVRALDQRDEVTASKGQRRSACRAVKQDGEVVDTQLKKHKDKGVAKRPLDQLLGHSITYRIAVGLT